VRTNRGLSIRGHVLGPTGAPISSASVSATLAGTQFKQDTSSNGDGSFLLGPLVAGDYDLTASVKVFVNYSSAADADATGFAPCGPVRTKAGDQSAILTMRPGGAIRCLLNSTVAVQDLGLPSVRILDSTGALAGQVMGASCRGLQPGMYSAFVSATSGACGSKTGIVVAAGETTDATITLDKGAKLRVSREPGATRIDEYQVLSDGVRIASRRSAIDQAYEHVVPAGHIVIRKHVDPDGWSEDAIDVSAGETREIVLRP
jgi:hypothetical protein